jgi:DNA helicase II / ATP-dependent DNA helicase PcrA
LDLLSSLNPEQQEAVRQTDGPLLILAGAGSGKTRVIAHRIAYLVSERIAYPDQIMAVTFTNKAAQEMRERVERLLDMDCRAMWISTFHALCARLLRREAPHIGLSRDFTIYDSADQQAVIKQLLKEYHLADETYQPRMVLARISAAKNRMEGPESFENTWNVRDREIGKLFAGYTKALRDASALDFDDLLLATVELFDKNPDVRERYAHRFRYVMVDEYQDTNRPQYLLIKQVAGKHRNLAVVGDPDQSIYKWRGADIRNIMDFETDFSDAAIVRLEQNYRSTEVILDAASAVIANNRNRKKKALWTAAKGGAKIRLFRGSDELEEAEYITRLVRTSLAEDHQALTAVLYRTNAQSRAVEDSLRAAGIAYVVLGGVGFYERREVKDALSYLKLVLNPHDDVALRRVINVPARGIGKGVMEALETVQVSEVNHDLSPLFAGLTPTVAQNSLWSKLVTAVDGKLLTSRQVASLAAFRDLITALAEVARRESVSTLLGKVLDKSGYLRDLRGADREPDGTGVGGARVRVARGRAVAGRVCRSAVPALRRGQGAGPEGRAQGHDDDLALGQRPGVSDGGTGRPRRGAVPAFALARRRGRTGGGAPALLRGHHARPQAAGAHQRGAAARVRGIPVDGAVTVHRRDPRRPDRARLAGVVVLLSVRRAPL